MLINPLVKCSKHERKLEFVALVSFLTLVLVSYCECQREICGTERSEAIDVLWIIDPSNDIQKSDFLLLKDFLCDMMLWFTFSNTGGGTIHGCFVYSDSVNEVPKYENNLTQVQDSFVSLKYEDLTSDERLNKALDYLANSTVASDRPTVPNVAVVVASGLTTSINLTSTEKLTEAGWDIIFIKVPAKKDLDKYTRVSEQESWNQHYYTASSFRELKSQEFQKRLALAICDHWDYGDQTKVRLRRKSDKKGYFNIAEKKPARQSSTAVDLSLFRYIASLANDGIAEPDFSQKSCSSTYPSQTTSWWEVDLEELYDIAFVSILSALTFRERIKFMDIIGLEGEENGTPIKPEVCGRVGEVHIDASMRFKCPKIMKQKRYVRIAHTEIFPVNALHLCEVEVTTAMDGGYYNVALNKTTAESSTISSFSAAAVDGDTNALLSAGSCTHTDSNRGEVEWWEVDLEKQYNIFAVTLFNRMDHYERLINFDIIGHNGDALNGHEVCATQDSSSFFFSIRHYQCEPEMLEKRYVRIQQNQLFSDNVLTLCEVEVWTERGLSAALIAVIVVVLLLVLAGAVLGGLYYYRRSKADSVDPEVQADIATDNTNSIVSVVQDPGIAGGSVKDSESPKQTDAARLEPRLPKEMREIFIIDSS